MKPIRRQQALNGRTVFEIRMFFLTCKSCDVYYCFADKTGGTLSSHSPDCDSLVSKFRPQCESVPLAYSNISRQLLFASNAGCKVSLESMVSTLHACLREKTNCPGGGITPCLGMSIFLFDKDADCAQYQSSELGLQTYLCLPCSLWLQFNHHVCKSQTLTFMLQSCTGLLARPYSHRAIRL